MRNLKCASSPLEKVTATSIYTFILYRSELRTKIFYSIQDTFLENCANVESSSDLNIYFLHMYIQTRHFIVFF